MADQKRTNVKPVTVRPKKQTAPSLEIIEGKSSGQVMRLSGGTFVIGRDPSSDIQLSDEGVSRRHAKLVFSSDSVVNLVDLESTNGTFLNGDRVELATVSHGDEIQIGPDAVLRFVYRPPTRQDSDGASEHLLSERELQVALLVAMGRSNNQIAEQLTISRNTVATHVRNIYARLEIHSRAALARYVVERGLLPDE